MCHYLAVKIVVVHHMGQHVAHILSCVPCHETTARAARLEQGNLVTLVRLVSNARVSQGFRHGILGDSATLPRLKGRRGFVRVEA